MRVEHWTNAAEQGAAAAKNLLAVAAGEAPQPYAPVPFFWSDQFDSRIQFLGRAAGTPTSRSRSSPATSTASSPRCTATAAGSAPSSA